MLIRPNIEFHRTISKQQFGFRKGCSLQRCPLIMLEKCKAAVNMGKCFGALLRDLSKAFNCLPNDLLMTKLNVCGFIVNVLRLYWYKVSFLTGTKLFVPLRSVWSFAVQDILMWIIIIFFFNGWYHSYKKQKDSLETRNVFNRNLYIMLKFTEWPNTPGITSTKTWLSLKGISCL